MQIPKLSHNIDKMATQTRPTPFLSDRVLFFVSAILVCFSLVMIYSTTGVSAAARLGDTYYFVKRQGIAAVSGIILLIVCSYAPLFKFRKVAPIFLFLSLIFLTLILIPGLGISAGGAKRWINLGITRFQPGECVKLLMVLFLAGYISRNEGRLHQFVPGLFKPLLCVGAVSALFLAQPDFGSAVVLSAVSLAMLAVSGVRLRYLAIGALFIMLAAGLLVVISPYRMARVVSFIFPWSDPSGKGYQLIQSLIAVGNGKVTGLGLGESEQKLFFLPAAHTDFIFAVVGEELGFLGCVALITAFVTIFWRGIVLAGRVSDDSFLFSLSIGLTLLIVLPALLNMGVVLGLLPTKGMVLPLVSYGGSNLLVSLATVGLLLALARTFHERS